MHIFIYLNIFRYENNNVSSFLENFEAIAQKHEQRRQKIKKDVEKKNQCLSL